MKHALWHWIQCTLKIASGQDVGIDRTQPIYDKTTDNRGDQNTDPKSDGRPDALAELEDRVEVLTPVLTPIFNKDYSFSTTCPYLLNVRSSTRRKLNDHSQKVMPSAKKKRASKLIWSSSRQTRSKNQVSRAILLLLLQ